MTKRNLFFAFAIIACLFSGQLLKAQGWEYLYPSSTSLNHYAHDVLLTTDGNYLGLAGSISGRTQIVKADPQGSLIWDKEYGGDINSDYYVYMRAIVNTTDGGFAMAGRYHFSSTDGGMGLYKLNSQGDSVWMKGFGCCSDWVSDLLQTSDGGYLLVGYKPDAPQSNNRFAHALKTDANGDLVWERTYFQLTSLILPEHSGYTKAIQRANGNYLLLGGGDGNVRITEIDGNGDIVNERMMENPSNAPLVSGDFEETMDGGMLVGGANYISNFGFAGGVLWKIDANSNLLWRDTSIVQSDRVTSLSENANGELLIGRGYFIEKRAADGSLICSLNADKERPWSNTLLDATPDGGAIAAVTIKPSDFLPELYLSLVKMDANCEAAVNLITGNANVDTDGDCINNGPGDALRNWLVELNDGQVSFYRLTDSLGNFTFHANDGTYALSLHPIMSYWESCQPGTTITLGPSPDTVALDLQAVALENCPYLVVDLASPPMRPCIERVATVSYANLGPATAIGAYLQVTLDSLLLMDTASVTYTVLPGNIFQFNLGDLAQGDNGQIWFEVQADCDLQLGNTVCLQANIFPDSLCGGENWAGATIQVRGDCIGDSILFEIKNTGPADMVAPLNYIVVEDHVMYMQGDFDLNAGQSTVVQVPNEHRIYTAIADQEAGFPFGSFAMDLVAFCQNANITAPFSASYFNLFPFADGAPTVDLECVEVTNSYDPNQLLASPVGFGEQHLIERNTPIEYHIDFQNTGTDTAYNITIRNVLPSGLDLTSLRPGASSHPYELQLEDQGTLAFKFNNINLLDSTANEPASHGFVEYSIQQKPDLPIGTVLENTAAIYFDFNPPIYTNTAWHTIGEDFIQVLNDVDETGSMGQPKVYPNPMGGAAMFEFPGVLPANSEFQLLDATGKLLRKERITGQRYVFERKGLAAGLYFYRIANGGARSYSGKVLLR